MSAENECRRIWDSVPVGLYQTSIETGLFIRVNPFCATLLGYNNPSELIGKVKSCDFYTDDRRSELIEALKTKKQVTDFEILLDTKKGKVWVSATAQILEDEGIIEGSLMDISVRKSLENRLIEYQKKEAQNLSEIQIKIKKRLSEFEKIAG